MTAHCPTPAPAPSRPPARCLSAGNTGEPAHAGSATAPTLARLLGVAAPSASKGKPLPFPVP